MAGFERHFEHSLQYHKVPHIKVWRWKGSYQRWLSVDETGYAETIGKILKKFLMCLAILFGRDIMRINPVGTLENGCYYGR